MVVASARMCGVMCAALGCWEWDSALFIHKCDCPLSSMRANVCAVPLVAQQPERPQFTRERRRASRHIAAGTRSARSSLWSGVSLRISRQIAGSKSLLFQRSSSDAKPHACPGQRLGGVRSR
eukprot:15444807-Alexandrium_andersonii.AAC.3